VAKIRQIHETLGIDTLPELEAAARDGRLARLPRFGAKTAENILKSIAFLRQASGWRLSHHAAEEAETLVAALRRLPGVLQATAAGEVRRRCEVVRDLVIVLVADVAPAELFERLARLAGVNEFAGQDERRVTLRFAGGSTAQIIVTTTTNTGAVMVQATGSEAHLAELSAAAAAGGFGLNGAALWKGSTFIPTPDEAAFYQAMGLAEIPPEMREGQGEVAAARDGKLPVLLERSDLQGFLHCHTHYSDGSLTVRELAEACQAMGYNWVGITDHSQAAAYAGGLSPDDLKRQRVEIDAVNAELRGIRILQGIEADILVDGKLDYDSDTLGRLDFVIGSIHSRFNLTEKEMTQRLLTAMDDPHLAIIGHPTGRLLLSREPYPIDMDAILEKAAATGTAIEINADPHRLDLDWRLVKRARDMGVPISIGSDAHNAAGIANVDIGVGIARKGWLRREDVLNSRTVEGFLKHVASRRGR